MPRELFAILTVVLGGLVVTAPVALAGGQVQMFSQETYAGYEVYNTSFTPTNGFAAVEGSWVEPSVTCQQSDSAGEKLSVWVGLGGGIVVRGPGLGHPARGGNAIIQVGTVATCSGSHQMVEQYFTANGGGDEGAQTLPVVVNPGDQVTARVQQVQSKEYVVSIQNRTTGASWAVQRSTPAVVPNTAEWIVEWPSVSPKQVGFPRFSRVTWSALYMGTQTHSGTIWDDQAWSRLGYNMVNSGTALATPGPVQFSGRDFWVDSNSGWNSSLNQPW